MRPAPMRSKQYGIAGNIASRQTLIAAGLPGNVTKSDEPRIPAPCLESIAVGTVSRLTRRMSSPNPGMSFSTTKAIASGV